MALAETDFALLLERYTNAMAAHNRCMTALIDAMTSDSEPSAEIVADEREAHSELIMARERLMYALLPR